ncbi:MAG: hypothetical protein V2B18_11890 [Pseudomonadota bacterium]
MRYVIIIVVSLLAVVFVGGALDIGRAPIFAHLDSALGTNVLMNLHYSVFYFLYGDIGTVGVKIEDTEKGVRDFQEKPIGIDNKGKYKQLDEAGKN